MGLAPGVGLNITYRFGTVSAPSQILAWNFFGLFLGFDCPLLPLPTELTVSRVASGNRLGGPRVKGWIGMGWNPLAD